jgi:hypothetical protein
MLKTGLCCVTYRMSKNALEQASSIATESLLTVSWGLMVGQGWLGLLAPSTHTLTQADAPQAREQTFYQLSVGHW